MLTTHLLCIYLVVFSKFSQSVLIESTKNVIANFNAKESIDHLALMSNQWIQKHKISYVID